MARPTSPDSQTQTFSVQLDPNLMAQVCAVTDDPSEAIAAGLRWWLSQQAVQSPPPTQISRPAQPLPGRSSTGLVPRPNAPQRRALDLSPNPADAQEALPNHPRPRRPNVPAPRRNVPSISRSPQVRPNSSNDDETGWLV
jgi:hypothetical protein